MSTTAHDSLERWLLDPSGPLPAVEQLRAAGVAAYAYARLAPDHPARPGLHGDVLAAFTRHLKAKSQLLPLLRAWHEAGIEVLLFKGFPLSEFMYPISGIRSYADVDLLIRPATASAALELALARGWQARYSGSMDVWSSHTLFTLQQSTGVKVDVHRWPVHGMLRQRQVHRRITDAVWSRSIARAWEGITIRLPDPVDALLVGLILQRSWGDRYHLRAEHAIDFQLLEATDGVTRDALLLRAAELRCERTVRAFLRQCDPSQGRLRLTPTTADHGERQRALLADRPDVFSQRWTKRLYQLRPALRWLPGALAALRRTRRACREELDPDRLQARLAATGAHPRALDWDDAIWAPYAVRWALVLGGRTPFDVAELPALVLFSLLRHQGWPAELVGTGAGTRVELDGRTLRLRTGRRTRGGGRR